MRTSLSFESRFAKPRPFQRCGAFSLVRAVTRTGEPYPLRSTARKSARPKARRLRLPAVGRRVDVDDLVGAAEIAHRLGVRRASLVHDWMRRYADFPPPVLRLSVGLIWHWPEVERWARKTGRLRDG